MLEGAIMMSKLRGNSTDIPGGFATPGEFD